MLKLWGIVIALIAANALAAAGDPLLDRQPKRASPYGQQENLSPPPYEQPRRQQSTYDEPRPRQFEREYPRQFEREYKRQY